MMKTIEKFKKNELIKNELVNVQGGNTTIVVNNPNGSVSYITFVDANGNGILDAGERIKSTITIRNPQEK